MTEPAAGLWTPADRTCCQHPAADEHAGMMNPETSPMPLRWTLDGLRVASSGAADGDQRDASLRQAWLSTLGIARCVVPRQIHGTRVVPADADATALASADGVVTNDPTLALAVYGADCPGLVLIAPDALGVAHCGWRGISGGIVPQLVQELAFLTSEPRQRWRAFIGPGIGGQHYEVDQPVLSAREWPAAAVSGGRAGHAHLDLALAIVADLAQLGITAVERSGICTASDARLWSYRRRGPGQVQLLVAWR
jgi:YfiH family protein